MLTLNDLFFFCNFVTFFFVELPKVQWVLPDKYLDIIKKDDEDYMGNAYQNICL